MTFDLRWPWTALVQGHKNYSRTLQKWWQIRCWVNRSRIGSHQCAFDWHHHPWSWMTLNRPRSSSQNFYIGYLECRERYNVGHSEVIKETTNGLSISIMTLDLGWPWTVLVQGHQIARQIFQNISRSRIENHPWAIDWHHYLWHWMTLNSPSSR